MSNHAESNKRLAKNTLTLYLRMILTVGISFYTTRVILQNLGVSDFGLYNVIGGFISMFYMVTSSLSSATSRFITYETGKGNKEKLNTVFCTSMNLQILLSFIVLLIGETVGLWFVNTQMEFAAERMFAMNVVYQLTILAFIFELLGIPYYSFIIAHEKIKTFAYVTIINVILKLIIAWCIEISPIDKVVFYTLCMTCIGLITQLLYYFYCKRHYRESKYHFYFDSSITKNMFSFGGWSFLSSVSSMLRGQGSNILLNIFFGTTVNAAYGVARQVDSTVKAFSNNFITALNPQITKSYAAGDYEHTLELVYKGTKYSFLLLFIIALPILFETEQFLDLWLVEIPQFSIEFVRLIIILALVEVLLKPVTTLNNATGHIKNFQIIVSISQFLVLPICYILLKLDCNPYFVIYITIGAELITFFPRIWINRRYISISLYDFIKKVLRRIVLVILIGCIVCFLMTQTLPPSLIRLLIVGSSSVVITFICTYIFALEKKEKDLIKRIIKSKIYKNENL